MLARPPMRHKGGKAKISTKINAGCRCPCFNHTVWHLVRVTVHSQASRPLAHTNSSLLVQRHHCGLAHMRVGAAAAVVVKCTPGTECTDPSVGANSNVERRTQSSAAVLRLFSVCSAPCTQSNSQAGACMQDGRGTKDMPANTNTHAHNVADTL